MNHLFLGDCLDILPLHFAEGSIHLCYIDPPFCSQRDYDARGGAFGDVWEWNAQSEKELTQIEGRNDNAAHLIRGLCAAFGKTGLLAYLVAMTLRITEIHRVLKPTGSFYLHCDPTASHYLKLVLDAVFVSQGGDYKNEIIWTRTNSHNIASKYFSRVQDTILYYTKSDQYTWNPQYTDFAPQQLKRYSFDPATGRMVTGQDLTMTGNASRNFTWRGTTPPRHRGWGFTEEQLEALWEQGLILTKQDGTPRLDGRKVFLDEKLGKPIGSVWADIERIGNTASERLGYPTQKPEALLERVIRASSNEGDVVLDAFCGCGTTVAVAQRLSRKWIGIDKNPVAVALSWRRLEREFGRVVRKEAAPCL